MTYSKIIHNSKHNHDADLNIKSKAKILRKRMTEAETALWKKLRMKQIGGLHFRKQHPFGIYILDFYCDKINLAIEVDGGIHITRTEYDDTRTEYLESAGVKVIRYSNEQVINNLDLVISDIKSKIFVNHPCSITDFPD